MFDSIQNQDLLNQRKASLTSQTNKSYEDMIAELGRQEELYKNQLAQGQKEATRSALTQENLARGTYGDLITQARQRARAMGGVTGSGVLGVYGGIDKNLQQNLFNIGQQRESELAKLQGDFNARVNAIMSDRTKSLREKEAMLSDIEFQYGNAKAKLDAAEKARRASSGYGVGYGNNLDQYGNVLGESTTNFGDITGTELDITNSDYMRNLARGVMPGRAEARDVSQVGVDTGVNAIRERLKQLGYI